MNATSLEESLRNFHEKKRLYLDFLKHVETAKADFDAAFPELRRGEGEAEGLSEKGLALARERLEEEKLKILFAGQFKTGKSALINAILGARTLPADPVPCTAVITEIEYGEKPRAVLHFKENASAETLQGAAKEHVARYGGRNVPPLAVDLRDEDSLCEYLAIKDFGKDQAESVKESPFAKCVVFWPLKLCENGAILIDSPGLNEAEARDRATMNYLGSADVIVHVLHAIQMCGSADRDFISKAKKCGGAPLVFAINRFDQLNSDEDREKIRQSALGHSLLQGAYGRDGIFFTSARKALEARERKDAAGFEESGVAALERRIGAIFDSERIKIKLGAVKGAIASLRAFSEYVLPQMRAMLDEDVEKLKKEYAAREKEFRLLDQKIDRMQSKAAQCLDAFSLEFESRAENFFRRFAGAPLEKIIDEAETSPISFLDRKEDARRACGELCAAVGEGLQDALLDWLAGDGEKIRERCLRDMGEAIDADLQDVISRLGHLREDLRLGRFEVNERALAPDPGVFLNELGNVGLTVGGIGAGLVFAGERFLPALISGPWGWGLMLATTAGSLLWTALSGSRKAGAHLRELFLREIRKKLEADIPGLRALLVEEATLKIREALSPVFAMLNERIADARRPIEDAVKLLDAGKDDLERKKALLAEYSAKFMRLLKEGEKLEAQL